MIGGGRPTVLIGERINPTGKKRLAEALRAGDLSVVKEEALAQVAAGADILDVNVGATGVDEISEAGNRLKGAGAGFGLNDAEELDARVLLEAGGDRFQ